MATINATTTAMTTTPITTLVDCDIDDLFFASAATRSSVFFDQSSRVWPRSATGVTNNNAAIATNPAKAMNAKVTNP